MLISLLTMSMCVTACRCIWNGGLQLSHATQARLGFALWGFVEPQYHKTSKPGPKKSSGFVSPSAFLLRTMGGFTNSRTFWKGNEVHLQERHPRNSCWLNAEVDQYCDVKDETDFPWLVYGSLPPDDDISTLLFKRKGISKYRWLLIV